MTIARIMRTGSSWKRSLGSPMRANQSVLEILQAADVVDDAERRDVVEERVDREVAAERVFFGRAEGVVVLDQQVGGGLGRRAGARARSARLALGARRDVLAKGRHLDGLGAEAHVRQAEAAADDPAVAEEFLDLVRMGRGADVEVLRPAARGAGRARCRRPGRRCSPTSLQPIQHLERVGVDVPARNRVLGPRDDHRFSHPTRHCATCEPRISADGPQPQINTDNPAISEPQIATPWRGHRRRRGPARASRGPAPYARSRPDTRVPAIPADLERSVASTTICGPRSSSSRLLIARTPSMFGGR